MAAMNDKNVKTHVSRLLISRSFMPEMWAGIAVAGMWPSSCSLVRRVALSGSSSFRSKYTSDLIRAGE